MTAAYRPQIDALRAVAVLGVLVAHFLWPDSPTGHLGVRLFFVISGFLITERLLSARQMIAAGRSGLGGAMRHFYLRRILRIFPAYYLLLAVLALLNAEGFRATALWHVFHLSNIRFAWTGDWQPWIVAHLWSLSIEEQFYALWPFLILLLPARWLSWTMSAVFLASVLFRYAILDWPVDVAQATIWVLPPASFDALAAGGLLALAPDRPRFLRVVERVGLMAVALWLGSFIAIRAGLIVSEPVLHYATWDTLNTLAFAGLVAMAHRGLSGPAGAILSLPPLLAIGRVSYGVYLYHLPVLAVALKALPWLDYGPMRFLVAGAATLIVASVSWILVERPCLRLKDRYARQVPI